MILTIIHMFMRACRLVLLVILGNRRCAQWHILLKLDIFIFGLSVMAQAGIRLP